MSRKLQTITIRGTATQEARTITFQADNYDQARAKVLDKTKTSKLPCGVKSQLESIYGR